MRRSAFACCLLAGGALAGCGGSTGKQAATGRPVAAAKPARPGCEANVRAALDRMPGLPRMSGRLRSGDAQSAVCAYRAGGERLTIEVDSPPQAYMLWETITVHQVQANVGRLHQAKPDEYPKEVHGVGGEASWIPSERELVATNATRERGGAVVRVTMEHPPAGAPSDRAVARRAARAALRSAPRGP